MTRIPALGPKRALQLYRELQVSSVSELTEAIKAGRLADLKGFGSKSEEKLLRGIDLLSSTGERVLLNVAADTAARIVAAISQVPGCQRCTHAGSLRRMRETIGDVDILAAATRRRAADDGAYRAARGDRGNRARRRQDIRPR